jgi:hypothetical protein
VLLAITSLSVFTPTNVNAQKGNFGVRFMPTFTSFNVKTADGNTLQGKVTMGFGAGVVIGRNFNKNVGLNLEIIYSTITQKFSEVNGNRKINLNYVNIPLLLSLNTGIYKRFNLNLSVGPQIGISVGSKMVTTGGDGSNVDQAILSIKKGDLGFAYGAGFDFSLNEENTLKLSLGYRGVYGVVDISNDNKTVTTGSYYLLDRTHLVTNSGYIGFTALF